MENEQHISVEQFCTHYEVGSAFLESLNDYGLIEILIVDHTPVIPHEQLGNLEKLVRMHLDLDINIEGLDAISHLLHRVDELQHELQALRNRLSLYDEPHP